MMNEFEKLIRDGWVEIKTSKAANFELAIERSHLRLDKKSVSDDNRFILLGTEDERDQVEMCKGMTYFYNPLMWRVKSLDNEEYANGRNKMHISETTSVRHEMSSCVEDDMLSHIVSKVKDAWWKSTLGGNGKIEIEWDSHSATVTAWDRGISVSRVRYSVVKDAKDMENELEWDEEQ